MYGEIGKEFEAAAGHPLMSFLGLKSGLYVGKESGLSINYVLIRFTESAGPRDHLILMTLAEAITLHARLGDAFLPPVSGQADPGGPPQGSMIEAVAPL